MATVALALTPVLACGDDDGASPSHSATVSAVVTASPSRSATASAAVTASSSPSVVPTERVVPAGFTDFKSSAHAYSMFYPVDWQVKTEGLSETFNPPGSADTYALVEFGPGSSDAVDSPSLASTAIEAISGHYGGNAAVVGVIPAGKRQALLLEWDTGSSHTYGLQAWVPNGDESWYITMITPIDMRADYENTFQQMLDSFATSK